MQMHTYSHSVYKLGNFTLGGGNIFKCLAAYVGIFVIFFTFYAFAGYKEDVPGYMVFLQFFYFIFYTTALLGAYKVNFTRKEFYVYVFIYSIIAAFLVRELSLEYVNNPFLFSPDANKYNWLGSNAVNKDLPYSKFLNTISEDWGLDDNGMPFIIYVTYKLAGNAIAGQYLLLFINAFVITGCAWRLDGIMRYFQIERKIRRFCVSVFAFFPFLSLTAGVGLKENFFLFIIISAFYYMFRYKETKYRKYLLFTVIFCLLTIFFRLATFAMMIISFFICMIGTEKNGKGLMRLMILGAVGGALSLSILLSILFGRNLDVFLSIAANRTGQVSEGVGSIGSWVIGFLAVFLGPFPNFSKLSEYAIVHSSGVLMKGVLGFPILMGMIYYSRKLITKYYPLLVYFLMNTLMVVLVGASLDMRFQIPFFPLALPYAARYLQDRKLKLYFLYYIAILFILIFFYNRR